MWGRLYLTPLLQAEEDRDQVRRYYADKAREKELLGVEHKVYNADRYVIVTEIQLRFSMDKSMMLIISRFTASSALPTSTLPPRSPNRRFHRRIESIPCHHVSPLRGLPRHCYSMGTLDEKRAGVRFVR